MQEFPLERPAAAGGVRIDYNMSTVLVMVFEMFFALLDAEVGSRTEPDNTV